MRKVHSRNRLLWPLAILLALVFVGGSAINYRITKASVHSEILRNDLPLTMNTIYCDLTSELARPIVVSSIMAADTFLQDWVMDGEQDPEKLRKYLLEIKETYNFFSTFFVSAHSLHYYHFKGIHKQISPSDSHDVWFYRFISSKKEYDLEIDTDEASNNILTVFINYRVEDEQGRLLGVAGVGLKMESVARLVKEYSARYGRNVYLTDRNGLIQVHQDTSFIEKVNIAELEGLKLISPQILALRELPNNFEYRKNGDRILLNVRYIDSLEWLLFVEQNETDALFTAKMIFFRTVGIGLLTSGIIICITLAIINRYQRQLEKLAVSDELTGVANRRKLKEEFVRFAYRFSRSRQPFCFILMDLDRFKDVNDTLGHLHGDEVLRTISSLVGKVVRPTDVLARWGGDEFAILTESPVQDAMRMAERVRCAVEQIEWPEGPHGNRDPRKAISLSIGVSQFREGETFDQLLSRADQMLYRSKRQGGNRIEPSG